MATKMKQVIVKVAERHIKCGTPEDGGRCPIALALRGITKDYVVVEYRHVEIGGKITALPKSARKFIHKFDGSNKVKPFNFRVKLPIASLKNKKG